MSYTAKTPVYAGKGANEPIRIAHVIGKMKAGGVESVVMNYYRHIDRSKVQFDFVIDADSTVVPYDEIKGLGGRVYEIPPYQRPIAYHKALVRLLRQQGYVIVHSHINALSVLPLFAAWRARVPARIAHSHSTAGKGETKRNIFKYILKPFSGIFLTHCYACSEYAARWLFGKRRCDAGRVVLIKNAIDIRRFAYDPGKRFAVMEGLELENRFVVGHVGRFMTQKNHSFLIDIFKRILEINPRAVLLLIGEGELERNIRAKADELNLTDYVRFLGIREDVHELMMAFDVFLLPSLYEGLPVVSVEAQASGLGMIVSDTVTKEAKINENFIYMSLSKSAQEWARAALDLPAFDREAAFISVAQAGYDIELAAKELCERYMLLR